MDLKQKSRGEMEFEEMNTNDIKPSSVGRDKKRPTISDCLTALRESGEFRYEREFSGHPGFRRADYYLITPWERYWDYSAGLKYLKLEKDKEFLAHLGQWLETRGIVAGKSIMVNALIIFLKACREQKEFVA